MRPSARGIYPEQPPPGNRPLSDQFPPKDPLMKTQKTPLLALIAIILALALALATAACKQPTDPAPAPAHAHKWGEWKQTTAPTCTTAGEETRVCSLNTAHTETRAGAAALGHDWGAWTVTAAPTATKNGMRTKACKRDPSHAETEPIAPTGIKADPAVTWPQGLTATYGQTLSDISLAAYANGGTGMFTWTTLNASVGSVGAQSHSMTFTPNDTADYNSLTQNVVITVNKANIADVELTITGPAKDSVPVTTAETDDINYTCGAVSWNPNNNPFLGGTVYTASVTLTADSSYTFINLSSATINGQNADISNNTGGTVTLSHTFAATDTRTATSIVIKTQPTKLAYTHGDPLDLTGLVITLTYDDDSAEDMAAAGFNTKNITANPAHGIHLIHVTHNGHPVTITFGSLPQLTTNHLTVNKAHGNFGTPAAINETYAPGLTLGSITPPTGYAWGTPSVTLNAGHGQSFSAIYTDPSGNYEAASGAITVNVAKAAGIFAAPAAINTTYTPALTLAALNAQLGSGYAWVNPPTTLNAGNNQTFAATYTDPSGNYEIAPGAITVNVAKATGATVNAPTAASINVNSVTLNAMSASTGQTVEYAIHSTNAAPSTGWQTGTTFGGLDAVTTYYIFARAAGNNNYETGAPSAGTAITTKQNVENEIIGYWVDDTGELSVGNGGQGNTITVQNGSSVTFTANGTGYSNQSWTLNGNTVGAGASYTFDTINNDKEIGRNYIIGLRVQKDGKFYFTEITITVAGFPIIYFNVTFNVNGASGATPDPQTVTAGSSIILPGGSGLTRSGYAFRGWNTNIAGTGTNYSAGVSYTPDATITLHAKWNPTRTVTINMYDYGGNGWDSGNQAALRINVNGVNIATYVTVYAIAANNTPSGQRSTNTYTFTVVADDVVQLYWQGAGSAQYENSFIMYYTDTPPSPAFTTSNNNNWNGSNALVYRLRTTSGTTGSNYLTNVASGTLLGSFTVQ
jgi:hypothetical protein